MMNNLTPTVTANPPGSPLISRNYSAAPTTGYRISTPCRETQEEDRQQNRMKLDISIVTVLYRSNAVLPAMIESIIPGVEIILVDNGDAPPDLSRLPSSVQYFKMGRNIGFGRACNYGAKKAHGEFILFLNPDAILRSGFFEALGSAIESYSACSVFCAATYVRGELFFPTATWIERQLNDERSAKIPNADFSGDCCVRVANGGAFAIRRSLFLEIGGFDPNIFLYFEDDDLSWRLLQRGQSIILVSGARVDHNLGTSTPPSRKLEFLRGYGKERATIYLKQKYGFHDQPIRSTLKISLKIILHLVTLKKERLYHQIGRLVARVNSIRP